MHDIQRLHSCAPKSTSVTAKRHRDKINHVFILFSFDTIEEACVMKQLKSLPPEGHLDILDMDIRLLNCGASLLAPSVTALLNQLPLSCTLPKDWKLVRVIPIYKGKGLKIEESNFRLISILGYLNMIIEREVQSQLYLISLNTIWSPSINLHSWKIIPMLRVYIESLVTGTKP